jgi:hypothetical protein
MSARDDLARFEAETDWPALVAEALNDPPQIGPLFSAFTHWARLFRPSEGGEPLEADFPEPVRYFFQRLAHADFPPPLWDWLFAFKNKKDRPAKLAEIPKRLRSMIPSSKRGRPRCDTRRYRAARRAWELAVFRESYELRRDMIKFLRGQPGVSSCFGFDQADMLGDTPSNLALALISSEVDLSTSRLDQMGIRRRKK